MECFRNDFNTEKWREEKGGEKKHLASMTTFSLDIKKCCFFDSMLRATMFFKIGVPYCTDHTSNGSTAFKRSSCSTFLEK